jgi:hypothetical protein
MTPALAGDGDHVVARDRKLEAGARFSLIKEEPVRAATPDRLIRYYWELPFFPGYGDDWSAVAIDDKIRP